MSDVQKAIQSIISSFQETGGKTARAAARPVVCISRDYGSGGDEVARLLAERLGVEVFDRQIVDRIAQRLDAEPETMRLVENGASKLRDLWLYSLVTGQNLNADHYKNHLINVIVSLARHGGVILGTGAHLILANSGALRVRITGSFDVCARRIAKSEGLPLDQARRKVEAMNQQRWKFLWDHFSARANDPHTFDLIINTDHIEDDGKIVGLLVDALASVGAPKEIAPAG